MARTVRSNPRARARALLGVALLVAVPWTAAGGERDTKPAPSGPLRTALAAVRVSPSASVRHTARRAQASNPALESPAFFKTRTGILVAGVMAAGVGYAIYSTHHDRIHSAGKQ